MSMVHMHEPITAAFVASVLAYSPTTGTFLWKFNPDRPRKWNSRYAGRAAGTTTHDGYIRIQIGNKNGKKLHYAAHVLAWLVTYDEWRPSGVDHRNGDRGDNRIENLRRANETENATNKATPRHNTSGFIGVSFDKQRHKWRARVAWLRKTYDVGFFDTAEEASVARTILATKIQGEFMPEAYRPRYLHSREYMKKYNHDVAPRS